MNSTIATYLVSCFLYALWASLVFAGKADSQPLVIALGAGVGTLLGFHGAYQAITKLQAVEPSPLNQAGAQE
jgi:hypothetical protein